MAKDTRAAFLRALAEVEPRLERAFREAVQDIRSTAQARVIEDVIRRYGEGQVSLAMAMREVETALQLGREFWAPLDRAIVEAYIQGGGYQANLAPKRAAPGAPRLAVRFDARHERAERWTRDRAGALITEITDDQRTVIRETIDEGIRENRGYRKITQGLIGTTEGNRRTGGLIGLHSRQAQAVRAARRDLEALDARYFTRTRRDRRFDRAVRKAIDAGEPLDAATIDKITGRYSDRLLQLRGQTIARTEGNKAFGAGRHEAVQQMIDSGKIEARHVTKVWVATVGRFTRDTHAAMNGQRQPWGAPFVSPSGAVLDRPHDEDAPAAETANCRCVERLKISWLEMAQ